MVLERATTSSIVLVCGDPRCVPLVSFYAGYSPPASLQIQFAPDFARGPRPNGVAVFALVNLRRPLAAEWYEPASEPTGYRVEKITSLGLPLAIGSGRVRLYEAGDGNRLWTALQPP